jgi:hypothetical protein
MLKPLLLLRPLPPQLIELAPEKAPLLAGFVERICHVVGARSPARIDVDCEESTWTGLHQGIWSRDLTLTIGLPLAAGLDTRQLAGVLAHDFGPFAQGAGMRLTFIIRSINRWFATVV